MEGGLGKTDLCYVEVDFSSVYFFFKSWIVPVVGNSRDDLVVFWYFCSILGKGYRLFSFSASLILVCKCLTLGYNF